MKSRPRRLASETGRFVLGRSEIFAGDSTREIALSAGVVVD